MEQYRNQRQEQLRLIAQKNIEEGASFLAKNKLEEGVTTLASGLQYRVLSTNGGKDHPGRKDLVTVHYRGYLIDGFEFDSSYSRGQPAKFRANQVIAGWTEALQLMSPGDKWEVFIPSELAYGAMEPTREIGPHRTLIFQIELIAYDSAKA